ncbi:MAG: GNAT family N-acetyltransferase [Deltaproteobacteria bacterium]|nr:GNAT family N-acetyltransferase [Deltaproteobacteria bacterium]
MYLANKPSLRKATADDIAQILEIESKATPAPWTQDGFSKELSKPYSHFLVLTDDETDSMVLGYIVFWILKDECEIFNLAVHLEYRGLGYAKIMLRKALDMALHANVKNIVLDVRKGNDAAISLYQSLE